MKQHAEEWGKQLVQKLCGRYTPKRPLVLPLQRLSFVGQGSSPEALAPLPVKGGGGKPFVQGWTHTSRRVRRFFKNRWQA